MYDHTSFYYLLLTILLLFLAGVIYVDLRSRRGWGLALLALAPSCYGVWLAYILIYMQRHPEVDDLAGAYIFAVYLGIFLALMLIVWIVALVEAGVSRHWSWLIGIFVAALAPGLFSLAIVTRTLGGPGLIFMGIGLFLAPAFTTLAYGIARIVRPVPLRAVRVGAE